MNTRQLLVAGAIAAIPFCPQTVSAQSSVIAVAQPRPLTGIQSCTSVDVREGAAWETLLLARQMEKDRATELLADLQDSLEAEAATRPRDIDAHYLLAVVTGSRADVEGGRTRVRLATDMYRSVRHVLAMEPTHPGAHHLLGRLNAAVLRMDGFTRFVATRLMGGGVLAGASWEDARISLEVAAAGAPCVPDHHYELARLYAERGEVSTAVDRLRDLLALAEPDGPYGDVHRKGRKLLASLEGAS